VDQNEIFDICYEQARKSNCKLIQFGVVLVKTERILGIGHNESLKGICLPCLKDESYILGSNPGTCYAVHAEWMALFRAIDQCGLEDVKGCTMYIAGYKDGEIAKWKGFACTVCIRLLKHAGVKKIIEKKGEEILEVDVEEAWKSAYDQIKGKA